MRTRASHGSPTHEYPNGEGVRKSKKGLMSKLRAAFRPGGALRPFRLLQHDLRILPRRYVSDWTGFNQLILASAVFVFFTNLLPGITFASDLYELTGKTYGTIEVVFSTGLCGIIFSFQPLTILGVTGPFTVLAENIYALCHDSFHIPFLPFMAWTLIHAAWMLYLLAIFNAHDWTMRYVTTFSTDIFSLLNSLIYFYKAIQELQRDRDAVSFAAFLYSIIGAIGTFLLATFLASAECWKPLFHRYFRMIVSEYAAAISIILFIGMPHIGQLATLDKRTLPVSQSFRPSAPERTEFFVRFWHLPVAWVFAALVPGLIITTLFFFDHERYGTKKPSGFAWDIVLLGTTMALCGILGLPPANGLLPQAPLHSESLLHTAPAGRKPGGDGEKANEAQKGSPLPEAPTQTVYEQRWSHLLHACGIMAFVSPPLMHVLGLTPTSVLAGLFLFMGEQSLSVNPILSRVALLLTPPSERVHALPSTMSHYRGIHAYTVLEIVSTVIIFVITLTKAAPVFPVLIILLVPIRLLVMNRFWNPDTLRYVDAWACKDGTPEDDHDAKKAVATASASASALTAEQGRPREREAHGTGLMV
ncbi:MAG: hypothetical protein M1826_000319 [Phylliscum demangeonii]|nr:MAG: hypothetical protein M1826_000319 [Phylliscum demangeonii]